MNNIYGLKEYISNLIATVAPAVDTTGAIINIKAIEHRDNVIDELMAMQGSIEQLCKILSSEISKAKITRDKELKEMEGFIDKFRGARQPATTDSEQDWQRVSRVKRAKITTPSPIPAMIISRPLVPVRITDTLSLNAIMIDSFQQVKQDGELYFVMPAQHFAIKICGKLLHGNIGVVYTDEKNPSKVKDCKYIGQCAKRERCDYYHDPLKFNGSNDYRNFVANGWLYSSYASRALCRRFGSRNHLDIDLAEISTEEVDRFQDQTMHDLLCALLLQFNHQKQSL